MKTKKKKKLQFSLFYFYFLQKYCDWLEDVLLLSSIVVGQDACLQLGELIPSSLNADMANFLSFDVYDIDLSKIMNDSNMNFVLLQTTSKSIIVVEYRDRFLTEKSMAVNLFVDVHIHFLLCDILAFKTLANSYMGLKYYKLFTQMEDIF